MAWIKTIPEDSAVGPLAQIYRAARERAGRVFNILSIQSLRPKVLRSSTRLYLEVMRSPESALSRGQREMIATTVSSLNGCFY